MHSANNFLDQVAADIATRSNGDYTNAVLILPSRRPFAFFRQAFTHMKPGAQVLPQLITMHDFMLSFCPYRVLGADELLLAFYQVYRESADENDSLTFERFYPWARQVLNDFNEVDKYRVKANELYRNLSDIKDIENWSFNAHERSRGQDWFESIWNRLPMLHDKLEKFLLTRSVCSPGFAYRCAAEYISSVYRPEEDRSKYFFAGLNALTASEETVVFTLASAGSAQVYLDGHKGYIDPPEHEAGLFLRKYIGRSSGNVHLIQPAPVQGSEITLYECPGNVAQVMMAASLLRRLRSEAADEHIAVVLSDESLLIPFLQVVDKDEYNVTMGWPLLHSAWFRYLLALTAWPSRQSRKSKQVQVPVQLVQQLVAHPLTGYIFDVSAAAHTEIRNHAAYYVSSEQVIKWLGNDTLVQSYMFAPASESGPYMVSFLRGVLTRYVDRTEGKCSGSMDREIVHHLLQVLQEMETLPELNALVSSNRLMRQLFVSSCRNKPLAFLGEPLQGVQIMGMLETRCLSFDRVIVLSANEGVLPSTGGMNGLIPFDLRLGHGLPGTREKDAVYAYYFYRLLQNTKQAHVLYASGGESFNRMEKSRYVLQLELEAAQVFPGVSVRKSTISMREPEPEGAMAGFHSTPHVRQKILEWMRSGVSVSALQTYLRCPQDFYYKYLAGIRETDAPEEYADEATYGTLVHDALHIFYSPFTGSTLESKQLSERLGELDLIMAEAAALQQKRYDFSSGKNLLAMEAARNIVRRFVRWEADCLNNPEQNHTYKLEALEEEVEQVFNLEGRNEPIGILLRGRIDRIHSLNGKVCIVDYKSGYVDPLKDLKLSARDFDEPATMKPKLLQLLFYEILLQDRVTEFGTHAGIYSLRNPADGLLTIRTDLPAEVVYEKTRKLMQDIFSSMLNETTAFTHNPDAVFCDFC